MGFVSATNTNVNKDKYEINNLIFSSRREYQTIKSIDGWLKHLYYSFKIFPRFRSAKSTRLIHHNQLLMTKFGGILTLTRK